MEERQKLLEHLRGYSQEFEMSVDVGYHLRLLIASLEAELDEDCENG